MVELVFLLDKSGSMMGLEKDVIDGFNSMLKKQKDNDEEVLVTTILFNDEYYFVNKREFINDISFMSNDDYVANGMTALLDALGDAIIYIDDVHKNSKMNRCRNKTLFVIITDGYENSSKRYTYGKIRKMIETHKEEHDWEFIYLGANLDAYDEALKFGIDKNMVSNYCCDEIGVALNYEAINDAIDDIKECGHVKKDWKDKIDKDYKKRHK